MFRMPSKCFVSFLSIFVMILQIRLGRSEFKELADVKVPTLFDFVNSVNVSSKNISDKCLEQLEFLASRTDIVVNMTDAWSKFPYTGLLWATQLDLGNYDECLSVETTYGGNKKLLGKHCASGIVVPADTTGKNFFKLSTCIPNACNMTEIGSQLNYPLVLNDFCVTKKDATDFTIGAIIVMAIFGGFGVIIAYSTAYDVYLHQNKKKTVHPILTAFSLLNNGRKLIRTVKHAPEQIMCFNGIKFISMMWIIAGHGGVGWENIPLTNHDVAFGWLKKQYSQYIASGHLGVDSFFYIGGFLLAFLYFKKDYNKPALAQTISLPVMLLHRFLRLTPALVMVFLFATFLSPYVGDGPLFKTTMTNLGKPCKDNWWAVFLYIQNYHNKANMCVTQLWYLSADMQLFIFSLFLLVPISIEYKRNYKRAMIELFVLNIIFIGLPIFTKLCWKDYDPLFDEFDAHSRLIDYFIGFMFGMFMRHEKNKNIKVKPVWNLILWAVTLVGMFGLLMLYQEFAIIRCSDPRDPKLEECYHGYYVRSIAVSLIRPAWCIGLCWITFSCTTGQGGIANWILSNRLFQIGGKLVYCMYLVHGNVVAIWILMIRSNLFFSDYNMFYAWCGHFMVTLVVAIIWTLSFESPMITIERLIFRR